MSWMPLEPIGEGLGGLLETLPRGPSRVAPPPRREERGNEKEERTEREREKREEEEREGRRED